MIKSIFALSLFIALYCSVFKKMRRMKKRILILSLILFVAVVNTKAQSIFVYFTDGTSLSSPLSEVQKINFNGAEMQMHKTDGVILSWPIQDIKKYTYEEVTTQVSDVKTENFNVLIYPNPSNGNLNIEYTLDKADFVNISLISINGSFSKSILSAKEEQGKHNININDLQLQAGTYFVKVQSNNTTSVKKIIILN